MSLQSALQRRIIHGNISPFTLKSITDDIPLRSEDGPETVFITCIEFWNENLYIGTSASELLHLVALPGESAEQPPTFILASRLQPSGHQITSSQYSIHGVQQILIFPGVSKACILCNGVVSFYTLPELTPASPSKEPTGVQWIGGIDENESLDNQDGIAVMIANNRRILLVKMGEKLSQIKRIDYPGCLRSSRRDTIACVANDTSYALLEVEYQQQIPLFPISSFSIEEKPDIPDHAPSGHGRSTSLGNPLSMSTVTGSVHPEGTAPDHPTSSSNTRDDISMNRPRSSSETSPVKQARANKNEKLKPHILTPTASEFMLVTGTSKIEPGMGMFVNLDGDVVRGTIEFDCYPEAVLAYDFGSENDRSSASQSPSILALVETHQTDQRTAMIEIQLLTDATETLPAKHRLPLPNQESGPGGLHQCISPHQHFFSEITDLLRLVRFKPRSLAGESDLRTQASIKRLEQESALFENNSPIASSPTLEYEQKRNEEEKKFVDRLGRFQSRAVVWRGSNLWQILENPLLLQLESMLSASGVVANGEYIFTNINISSILSLLGSIRQRDTQSEVEFLSMSYIRQKASLILFLHLQSTMSVRKEIDSACQIVNSALLESSVDPRVVLLLTDPLSTEVLQGSTGIWLHQGVVDALTAFTTPPIQFKSAPQPFWLMIYHFLGEWQGKRGYGSIANEDLVFDTVDAALLHLLLFLDQEDLQSPEESASIRRKLHKLVDEWKGNFQRAIYLLEQYQRLFVLSRLYHSRRLIKDVLSTWRRIAEGQPDADCTLTINAVEIQIRKYLLQVTDASLVRDYGVWLAKRNPDLAVELFADDNARVKLVPMEVVAMLKDQAPGAVQKYLEYLVFGKHLDQYADDLIGYYLDSVLSVLEESEDARKSLEESYVTYRALEAPKPTYLNFITNNTPPQPWWQSRLRLLQLLGSGGYAKEITQSAELTYSVDKVLERLKPFSSYLVSESIILDARQGRHKEALQLLIHGLGDYDTAVRYCYFGGPAPSSVVPLDASLLPQRNVQQEYFRFLFLEFLQIEDPEECLERTSSLLGAFATWFDPLVVIESVPQNWSVETLAEFLLRSIRAATTSRNEALIVKALSAAQNLQKQASFIDLCEKFGAKPESGDGKPSPLQNEGNVAS